jgi:hypothetical protein
MSGGRAEAAIGAFMGEPEVIPGQESGCRTCGFDDRDLSGYGVNRPSGYFRVPRHSDGMIMSKV